MSLIEKKITDTIVDNYMPYVMSVIVSRAIPEIDGFKPSHRKILYTMYKMKLLGGQRTKSANVVGQTMKLNPHGDQAIYQTMVRLASGNESLLLPYVDSKGNFGKVSSRDMQCAAPRYTEVRLQTVCESIFRDIEKDNVDFVDNYDGSTKEPVLLPTVFPNILANPNMGIAVGMASNIAGFNLNELCKATIEIIKNPDISVKEIMKIMPAPDFSTGGELIYENQKMHDILSTGLGSFKLRGKLEYDKKENILLITQIPYTTTVEQIIDKIVDLIKSGKIKEINDIRDETDLKGLKIAMDLKRRTDWQKLAAKLFKMTSLTDSFSCNFNLLINGEPMVLGVKDILQNWLDFRHESIKRSTRFDIDKKSIRLNLLYGLKKVMLDIDRAVQIIRQTESDQMVIKNLMKAFEIDLQQAEFVADIKLRNLNKDYIISKTAEINQLEMQVEQMRALISNKCLIDKRIIEELNEVIAKYGSERKTNLISPHEVEEVDIEEPIEDFNLKLFVTEHGYVKKISLVSLRSSGDQKIKQGDEVVQELEGSNLHEAIFFTNKFNAYKLRMHELEEHRASELGAYLANVLDLEDDEVVLYTVLTSDFTGHMIFGFENGKVARIPLSSYKTKQNRRKLVKAYYEKSPLVRAIYVPGDVDITLIRQTGSENKALIVSTGEISEKTTKNSQGVQVFRMAGKSKLIGMFLTESYLFKDYKDYVPRNIPNSGRNIDPIDAITIDRWIKS